MPNTLQFYRFPIFDTSFIFSQIQGLWAYEVLGISLTLEKYLPFVRKGTLLRMYFQFISIIHPWQINMEPENDGLVQINFPDFNWVVFRWTSRSR